MADDSSQPYRMTYFLKSLGFQALMPTEMERQRALTLAPIKNWPEEGSIVLKDGLIIVKLSD